MQRVNLKSSSSSTRYVADGREYTSLDDVPEPARSRIEATLAAEGPAHAPAANTYEVDGRSYGSLEQMPASDRRRFELMQRLMGDAGSGAKGGAVEPSADLVAMARAALGEPGSFGMQAKSPAPGGPAPGEMQSSRNGAWLVVVDVLLAVIAYLLLR